MSVRLTWTNNSSGHDGTRIYRDAAPLEPEALPMPIGEVAAGVEEYIDTGMAASTTYYYRAAAYRGGEESVSEEISATTEEEPAEIDEMSPSGSTFAHPDPYNGTIAFSSDGLQLYVFGKNLLRQYELSAPWDITTASQRATVESPYLAYGGCFSSDGLSLLFAETGLSAVKKYNLASAWDVSSITGSDAKEDLPGMGRLRHIELSDDGSKLYALDYNGTNSVVEYDLASPLDFGTATKSSSLPLTGDPRVFAIYDGGTRLVTANKENSVLTEWVMSTPWDLSTATESGASLDVKAVQDDVYGLVFVDSGQRMFVSGYTPAEIAEYTRA
ncbi:YncE family protein [Onishia taeanensis]|nr:hypothetical protein [Halomonas taeanensis]